MEECWCRNWAVLEQRWWNVGVVIGQCWSSGGGDVGVVIGQCWSSNMASVHVRCITCTCDALHRCQVEYCNHITDTHLHIVYLRLNLIHSKLNYFSFECHSADYRCLSTFTLLSLHF